ncbi:fructofuranosidase [Tritrichomonas foetus]|nr:fructofuranosidase [Tritrichomonas foetus]AAB51117.1 fructofuranosidase [Tritrichomonas foetus]OHT06557.1 fructofuranosidase [Tritrichomonas foetus]|eukprot:OHT06557.1 fructofuranosidase [Tritrichomonas foetus]
MSGIQITRTHNDGFNPVVLKFDVAKKYLLIPIEEEAPERPFTVINSKYRRTFLIRLAVKKVEYNVPLELEEAGTVVEIYKAPAETAIGWSKLELADSYDTTNTDYYRPNYHFTPPFGWMNDPNGLFYLDGVYHLYYQHNPFASTWGNMSWGHATTKDFVHYEHHPIVLFPDELGHIFSGSIVIDKDNTAGFGANAVIAFYTNAGGDDYQIQTNSIAYSTDGGYTFTKYENNPVVTFDCRDFRDPTVIRYNDQWNLFIATGQCIRIYSSLNLKEWKYESTFGRGIGCHDGVWECPAVLKVDGKWVILLNINPGGPFGGSATQYFVGEFDGHQFICESDPWNTKWMDYGRDAYATVCFHNAPVNTAIAWMSNWDYAKIAPTHQFRSAFSIPRIFKLVECPCSHEHYLYSYPLPSFEEKFVNKVDELTTACLATVDLSKVTAKQVRIILKNQQEEVTLVVNREVEGGRFEFERGLKSGLHTFSDAFCCLTHCPYQISDHYQLKLFVDKHSVEVFDGAGSFTMTTTVFPRSPYTTIVVEPIDGECSSTVTIKSL